MAPKDNRGDDRVMSLRRFAIIAAALCGTVILVGYVIAAVPGFGLSDIKNTHAPPIEYRATETGKAGSEAVSAAAAVTAIAESALTDSSVSSGKAVIKMKGTRCPRADKRRLWFEETRFECGRTDHFSNLRG
jgi:hypothetical protein